MPPGGHISWSQYGTDIISAARYCDTSAGLECYGYILLYTLAHNTHSQFPLRLLVSLLIFCSLFIYFVFSGSLFSRCLSCMHTTCTHRITLFYSCIYRFLPEASDPNAFSEACPCIWFYATQCTSLCLCVSVSLSLSLSLSLSVSVSVCLSISLSLSQSISIARFNSWLFGAPSWAPCVLIDRVNWMKINC
jgi:hypothetical protein